ncbi:MAG: DUF4388 domain-containing protein [Candidatus Melainabacteria bacterium]|nr:DUF4388 domain-containing protein [Candidatus Melainabacteria bacterium]
METTVQQTLTSPVLSGELSEFNLVHILQLLNDCNANGVLQVKKGALYGVMYFEHGQIIDAHVLTYDGEDAIYEIFLWLVGRFAFYSLPIQRPKTIKRPTEDLILTGARYDERWRKLCKLGINSKTILKAKSDEEIARMITEEEEGTIHLAQADQEFLHAADGTKSLGEIANQLGYNRRKIVTILSFLLTNNFLDIVSTDHSSPFNDSTQVFMPELD